jgi:hypothetical protein
VVFAHSFRRYLLSSTELKSRSSEGESVPIPTRFFPLSTFFASKDVFGSADCNLSGVMFPDNDHSLDPFDYKSASSHRSFSSAIQSSYSDGASISFRVRNLTVEGFKLELFGHSVEESPRSVVCLEIATEVSLAEKWVLNKRYGCAVPYELTRTKVVITRPRSRIRITKF